jgi:hypothetical protein
MLGLGKRERNQQFIFLDNAASRKPKRLGKNAAKSSESE